MAKKIKRNGVKINGSFTPILNEVHDSLAYKEISGNSAKMYIRLIEVARKLALKSGNFSEGNVQFNYTYSEAKRVLGFSESTTRRCLKELWAKGFISVIKIGGVTASDKRGRMSSVYQLCGNWRTYGNQWTDRTKCEEDPWAARSEPKKNETARW